MLPGAGVQRGEYSRSRDQKKLYHRSLRKVILEGNASENANVSNCRSSSATSGSVLASNYWATAGRDVCVTSQQRASCIYIF
jgi:hypothetical protein